MSRSTKHIVISETNYEVISEMGKHGETFNDIISRLIHWAQIYEQEIIQKD